MDSDTTSNQIQNETSTTSSLPPRHTNGDKQQQYDQRAQ
jgi:hypothetical protein